MAGPYLDPVPLPPGDPAGLAAAARTYLATAGAMGGVHSGLTSELGGLDWQGAGHDGYEAKGRALASTVSDTEQALQRGSVALSVYSAELAQAQALARRAQAAVEEANVTASAMLVAEAQASDAASQAATQAQAALQAQAAAVVKGGTSAQAAASEAVSEADRATAVANQAVSKAQSIADLYGSQRSYALSLAAEAHAMASAAATKASSAFTAVAASIQHENYRAGLSPTVGIGAVLSLAGVPKLGGGAASMTGELQGPMIETIPIGDQGPLIETVPAGEQGPLIETIPIGQTGPLIETVPIGAQGPLTETIPIGPQAPIWNIASEATGGHEATRQGGQQEEPGPTVGDVLRGKKGSITGAPLPAGSPSWTDIRNTPISEIRKGAQENKPGYKTILKLLTDKRFNK